MSLLGGPPAGKIPDGFSVKLVTMSADEPELIHRAQRDPRAFGPLYDRYVRRIHAFVFRRMGDATLAQDVTSATFEKALQSLPRYRWRGVSFGAWLYRIARNEIVQAYRRDRTPTALLDWQVLDEPAAPGVNGHNDALHTAFTVLPDADREVLTLRFFEDLDSAEVAEVLGISISAVYVRVHRALKRLRAELEKIGHPEADHV